MTDTFNRCVVEKSGYNLPGDMSSCIVTYSPNTVIDIVVCVVCVSLELFVGIQGRVQG
jgi:hypothetical protein